MTRQTAVAWLIFFFVLDKYGFLLYKWKKKNNIGKIDSFGFTEAIRINFF